MGTIYKTEQEAFWAGAFGDAYCRRNRGEKPAAATLALSPQILRYTDSVANPIEIDYRGHRNRLIGRYFAGEMLGRFPDMQLLDYGFVYRRYHICA